MMETVRTSETSVSLNVITRRYFPEDSKLQNSISSPRMGEKWSVTELLIFSIVIHKEHCNFLRVSINYDMIKVCIL
jgi:hypothetical protein